MKAGKYKYFRGCLSVAASGAGSHSGEHQPARLLAASRSLKLATSIKLR